MKKLWVWLMSIAMLSSVVACGGGHDDHSARRPFGVAGIMEGIWNGNLHSNLTGRDTGMFVIVTAGGAFSLITDDCGQISANIAADGSFFSGAGTTYLQTNCDGADVTAAPFTVSAGPVQPFQIAGEFDDRTGTAFANYTTANDSGTISFLGFYQDYFDESGTLPRTTGAYSISRTLTALSIDANGSLSYRDAAGQIFPGTLSIIDPTVDVYRMTLHVGSQTLTGMATLVDDGHGRNNDFLFAVANGALAYNAELRRN
ncbi:MULTISPECIES: hypothetical protein [Paraburkholderia]|uniref:hypothetical protein n=1 Tax=Paraburkholderia TaxID=1822464 RepID=UPI000362C777|nr:MULTISPECIES: hypothetical protein [Paraburkholderia]MDH6153716.1 hypothetical protein [Paraburkholderia sp. WSM4179]